MSEYRMGLIAFIVFYLAVFWSCYYFGRWLRCRIEFRRKFRPVRMALKRQRDALTRLERSVRRLEEAANGMTAECARLKDCGVLIHKGNTDPSKCGCITAQAERCEVCGEILLKDGNGELRCFKCNPTFAVGDAVWVGKDCLRATVTKIGDGYIEVQDCSGNLSACHECDIKMSYDLCDILDGNPNWDGMDMLELYKFEIMPIISAYPSAMRYFSDFDIFDKTYKLSVFQCPKCGGFYLYDSNGHNGCLDCGYVEKEKKLK